MYTFKKFLNNDYIMGPNSPLSTLDGLDEERLNIYIENINKVINKEILVYKNIFGIIKSTLEDAKKRLDEVKDISNYLPKIVRIDKEDFIDELDIPIFKPTIKNNITLPSKIDWVALAKEYKIKSDNQELVDILLNIEVNELNLLYIKYIQNNITANFNSLFRINNFNKLIKLLAIVDLFNKLEPLDDARGDIDTYKALFKLMYINVLNLLKMLNKKIELNIQNKILIMDSNSEIISINPYEYRVLLEQGMDVNLIYGVYLISPSTTISTKEFDSLRDRAKEEFNKFKNRTSLKIGYEERVVLESVYHSFFNTLQNIYGSNIDFNKFKKELSITPSNEILSIDNMLVDIVAKYILPNSNIKLFVNSIDKYINQGIDVEEAREMAIYTILVDYLLKGVQKG